MNQRLAMQMGGFACLWLAAGCASSTTSEWTGGEGDASSDAAAAGGKAAGGAGGGAAGSTGTGGKAAGGAGGGAAGSTGTGGSAGATSRGCNKVFYSGEPGEITLIDCGTWSDPKTMDDGTSTFKEITDNPYAGTTSLQISLAQVAGTYGTDWGLAFGHWNAASAIDASKATELVVWMKADHQTGGFNLFLNDSNKGVSTFVGVPTLGTEWTEIRIPMSKFAKAGFDPSLADTLGSDMHDDGHGGVIWYLDEGVFEIPCQ